MKTPLLLDLSRLLARASRGSPTGIDRVEHAYAEQLLVQAPDRLQFVAIDKLDRLRTLPWAATRRFVAMLGEHWRGTGVSASEVSAAARMIWVHALLRPTLGMALPRLGLPKLGRRPSGPRPYYLLLSHRHLHRRDRLERAVVPARARLVTFVHDLIPIEFPEYARPQHADIHLSRIRTAAALSDAIIVNSHATATSLQPYLDGSGRASTAPSVLVAPLGASALPGTDRAPSDPAYFVCLGTIEPRKNHLLLLNIWRRLAEERGQAAPHLVIVGRRGWEHENIEDMLDRCPGLRGLVTERTGLTDQDIGTLLRGSRALLFPSFAEGYGLPLAEALASGVPAICSDLPALREVGGDVPDYLDPLDGMGWMAAIADYAGPRSARRQAQRDRMRGWRCPGWTEHVSRVLDHLDLQSTTVLASRTAPALADA